MGDQHELPNPFHQAVLQEIIKEERLKCTQVKVEPGSTKGDNYLSVIYRVQVNSDHSADQDEQAKQEKLSLIVKCMPTSKLRREQMNVAVYFRNEANFYNKVLKEFLSFQRDRGVPKEERFSCTAKCYRAVTQDCNGINLEDAEEVLIMEDMKDQGYVMRDRRISLDVTHCRLVVEQLAKFHAFSLAMRRQKPEEFNNLKNSVVETLFVTPPKEGFIDYVETLIPQLEKALLTRVSDDSLYKKRINKFIEKYYEKMVHCVDGAAAEPYAVICHGDCWTNNFLFKYSKYDAKPIGMVFLDFQVARYASPVLDLSHFFFCCTDQALRSKHYTHLLTRYYDSLAHFICQLGSDPQQLFPPNVFKEQLVKYSCFGLGIAILAMPLFTSNVDDIPDFNDYFEESEIKKAEIMEKVHKKNTLYNERMSGIIIDVVDLGYI